MTLHKRIPPLRPSRNLSPAKVTVIRNGALEEQLVNTMQPCVAVGAFDDGLLPVDVANNDLIVEIPVDLSSPVFEDGALGTLQLMWKGARYGTPYQIVEADLVEDAIELTLEQSELSAEGTFELNYVGKTFPGGNELFGNPPLTIEVDRTAPGGENMPLLVFSDDIVSGGVTPDKFDGNDNLPSRVAHWRYLKLGDQLFPLLKRDGVPTVALTPVVVVDDTPGIEIPVPFALEKLKEIGDGETEFTYYLKDRAGNQSDEATPVSLQVLLSSVPRSWPAPEIPLAPPPERIVGETEARRPVGVEIPADDNFQQGDLITVHWGDETVQAEAVGDPTSDPVMTIQVPYSVVQAAGDGPQHVVYRVVRNNIDIGVSDPVVTVEVDLVVPGGEDPDPETPEHGNLAQAMLTADSGAVDHVAAGDFGEDAKITIAHAGIDSTEVFEEDDIVTVQWGSTTLGPYTITNSDVGKDYEATLTGAQMSTEGAGDIILRYTVAREMASKPGEYNSALSPSKTIQVISPADLPGGGSVNTGSFPEANENNAINSDAAASGGGTPFRVSAYLNMAVGDTIVYRFIAYDGYGSAAQEVPESEETGTRTISQDDITQGYYEFLVPSAKLYLAGTPGSNPGRGKAEATFTVTNDKGTANGVLVPVLIDAQPAP